MASAKPVKNIRLSEEVWNDVIEISEDEERSVNNMVSQLIKRGIIYTRNMNASIQAQTVFNHKLEKK